MGMKLVKKTVVGTLKNNNECMRLLTCNCSAGKKPYKMYACIQAYNVHFYKCWCLLAYQ